MQWRDSIGTKLVTAEKAVENVQSGDTVAIAPYTTTPLTLCNALAESARNRDLTGLRIEHLAAVFQWTAPELRGILELTDNYATPLNRAACHAGEMNYVPVGLWKSYELPAGFSSTPNVFLLPVSPPDRHGFCSFGTGVWMSPTLVRGATLVIAEVREEFIHTYGENYVHID